jgi:hypothetical protein
MGEGLASPRAAGTGRGGPIRYCDLSCAAAVRDRIRPPCRDRRAGPPVGVPHALWNALLRLEDDKDRSLVAAVVVAALFAAAVAAVRWELGAAPFASLAGVGFTLLAGMLEAAYFATLARAMELGTLGVAYTISRGGAVLALWPLSIALFAEAATLPALAGSGLVVGGLALSGIGGSGGDGAGRRGAVGWAVACAMSIAGYHLAYKAALREAVNPSACFALSLAVAAAINGVRLGGTGGGAIGALVWRTRPIGR